MSRLAVTVRMTTAWRQGLFLLVALLGGDIGQGAGREEVVPQIRRIAVFRLYSYWVGFDVSGAHQGIALARTSNMDPVPPEDLTTNFYIYGADVTAPQDRTEAKNRAGPGKLGEVLPWSVTDHLVLWPARYPLGSPQSAWLMRFKLHELRAAPGPAIEGAKQNGGGAGVQGVGSPPVFLRPVAGPKSRHFVDEDGTERLLPNIPEVHYDFRALDDESLDLVVAVDGRLSRWLFEGEEWRQRRTYNFRVDGEFMILEDGASLVAQREDRWCVFSGFEEGEAKVTPIVAVDGNEPMTVVDDVDAKRSFLHYRDGLYDAEGHVVERIPGGLNPVEKVRALAKAVRQQPQEEPRK